VRKIYSPLHPDYPQCKEAPEKKGYCFIGYEHILIDGSKVVTLKPDIKRYLPMIKKMRKEHKT